jgi:hypothetical protein
LIGKFLALTFSLAVSLWSHDSTVRSNSEATIDVTRLIEHEPTEIEGRDPDVPELPFADNPNPELCGIPEPWRNPDDSGWLTGIYGGELVEPTVFLYDSHLRLSIAGSAPHGTQVRILMSQANPSSAPVLTV